MTNDGSLHMSQGLDVLPPKSGPAYPIPCNEWDVLKTKLKQISNEPWFFHTLGSILLGAALATLITLLLGTFDNVNMQKQYIIAWAVVSVTSITGLLCMYFAHKERDVKRQRGSDLTTQMELIEERFERHHSE
ncbi:MAG: hypothetical protein HQ510_07295 [Candidatus Marinimicrobia bacterium]|nr:hypothetical protein [Candidatus Neomarinimicrobiota bacterium]